MKPFILSILIFCGFGMAMAQCPANIGFEEGNYNHWECYVGRINSNGVVNVSLSQPTTGRHTMYKNTGTNSMDMYGNFPEICPNGSGYSIKLGNVETGAEAERVSYTFTIPPGQNEFSLIYNYAVVFQNPSHQPEEQPRFTAKVYDVTAGQYIDCSSFDYAASGNLPGFKNVSGTDVYYKPWSPVTIKLNGYAGKTIRLEFTTNDCTKGGHFGYAYLDIDENCTSPIQGNTFCLNASSLSLTAPFGYKDYSWHDVNFTTTLGNANTLDVAPIPAPGTRYAVIVSPYPGSGCTDTLYTTIALSPVQVDFRLTPQIARCAPAVIDLTDPQWRQGSSSGLTYTYYTDPGATDYLQGPSRITTSGTYYIRAANAYGCRDIKAVNVAINPPPSFTVLSDVKTMWPNKADITPSSLLGGNYGGLQFSYWYDAAATRLLSTPAAIDISGTYYIKGVNNIGCSAVQPVSVQITPPPPPNAFSPNNDGINDVWMIPGLTPYPSCTVSIYDRYGSLVFESSGYRKPWDGSYNGKPLPMGAYYYVIRLSEKGGFMSGNVMLMK